MTINSAIFQRRKSLPGTWRSLEKWYSRERAMLSSTFFGGLKASRRWKLKKKLLVSKILSQTNWVLYFLKYFTKGFVADKVWGISIFPSCTPIRGIYRKLLLNTKIRSTMLCLSCFELYSRWVPLNINIKLKPWPL